MATNTTTAPPLHVTIEGLRAQIIANATTVFTVPATLYDKENGRPAKERNKKDVIFEVIVGSDFDPQRQPDQELFEAAIVIGNLFERRSIAIGNASNSMGGAMNNLLRLTMAELGKIAKSETKGLRRMFAREIRQDGAIDTKFL